MALIDKLAPFMTPQADVAGALNSFADSIAAQNRTDAELRNQRELRQAQLAQSHFAVEQENKRAQATIDEAKRRQEAEFGEKKREQQSTAVKDFTTSALSGDPAAVMAAAPYLKTHGVEMSFEAPESQKKPLPSISPATNAMGMVDQVLAAPPAPQEPEKPPSIVRLRTSNGEELGSFDLSKIGEERRAAIEPVLNTLMATAAPLERAAYKQQIATAFQSPAMMALGAPALVGKINEAAKAPAHEAHQDVRTNLTALALGGRTSAADARANRTAGLAEKRMVLNEGNRTLTTNARSYGIPAMTTTENLLKKGLELINNNTDRKTGVVDFETLEAQTSAMLGSKAGIEAIKETMSHAGVKGRLADHWNDIVNGGHINQAILSDIKQSMRENLTSIMKRKKEAEDHTYKDIVANPVLQDLMPADRLKAFAKAKASQIATLTDEEERQLDILNEAPPEE